MLKGSESGEIVVRGKPDDSLLYEMVHDGLMPPEEAKKKLTKADLVHLVSMMTEYEVVHILKTKAHKDCGACDRICNRLEVDA